MQAEAGDTQGAEGGVGGLPCEGTPRIVSIEAYLKHRRHRDLLAVVLILCATVLARLWVGQAHAVELVDAEEFLNLRLARQLLEGHPIGDLETYWFRHGPGPNGGPLVLSILYVPLVALFGATTEVVRLMAGLWAAAFALSVGLVARELFGARGLVLGVLLASLLSPSWSALSTSAKGNHIEGAVLATACTWLALRHRRTGRPGDALLLGAALAIASWFADIVVLPALGLAVLALIGDSRRWTLLGLAGGGLLWWFAGPVGGTSALDGGIGGVLAAVSEEPGRLWFILTSSLLDQPLLDALSLHPEGHWGGGWRGVQRVWALAVWIGVGRVAWRLRRTDPDSLSALAPLTVSVLLMPLAFILLGMGPDLLDRIGYPRSYFWEPRRLALWFPLHALVLTGLACGPRSLERKLGGALAAAGLVASLVFVWPGERRPDPFQPERFLLCPGESPAHELSVCIPRIHPGDHEELIHLLDGLRDQPWQARGDALNAWRQAHE